MTFYNMMFGKNPAAPELLAVLKATAVNPDEFWVYRERDIELETTEAGTYIAVLTRGGAGNRDCYCRDFPEWKGPTAELDGQTHFADCVMLSHAAMCAHPWYEYDEDEEDDCTYATFYFRVPDKAQDSGQQGGE